MEVNILTLGEVAKKYGIESRKAYEFISEVHRRMRAENFALIEELNVQPKETNDELHTASTIRTFKGHYVDVFNPDPETIDIEDIAHGLSNTCRFGGHTYVFYSVAQHSSTVARHELMPEDLKLTALLHDATEAYMCDLPRPIKRHLPSYKEAEEKLMQVIANKFHLEFPFPKEIKAIDNLTLELEHEKIMLARNYPCLPPDQAKNEFMYYYKLYTQVHE